MSKEALLSPPTFYRTKTLRDKPDGVDMELREIRGYSVIQKGEALGHGEFVDDFFLEQADRDWETVGGDN